jgi:hypothetical protein
MDLPHLTIFTRSPIELTLPDRVTSVAGGSRLAKFDLRNYARRGAETRIAELNEELQAIFNAFPELRAGRAQRSSRAATAPGGTPPKGARKRRRMSAAQRKAVGERMKKYWAARKKGAAK